MVDINYLLANSYFYPMYKEIFKKIIHFRPIGPCCEKVTCISHSKSDINCYMVHENTFLCKNIVWDESEFRSVTTSREVKVISKVAFEKNKNNIYEPKSIESRCFSDDMPVIDDDIKFLSYFKCGQDSDGKITLASIDQILYLNWVK